MDGKATQLRRTKGDLELMSEKHPKCRIIIIYLRPKHPLYATFGRR